MMNKPEIYAEWCDVLDVLKAGTTDSEVLAAMSAGTLAWQSGVAERFMRRLTDALNARLERAMSSFNQQMGHGGEADIVGAITSLRATMRFLQQVASIEAIPLEQRTSLVDGIAQQAQSIQDSLIDSAQSDRTGRLASIIRNNPVTGGIVNDSTKSE